MIGLYNFVRNVDQSRERMELYKPITSRYFILKTCFLDLYCQVEVINSVKGVGKMLGIIKDSEDDEDYWEYWDVSNFKPRINQP